MKRVSVLLAYIFMSSVPALGQSSGTQLAFDTDFKLSLPAHPGQLQWHADGFKIIEASAKSKGQEIGLRGKDESGRLTFLGFLFLVPEQAPQSSAKCRDGALAEQKNNSTLKVLAPSRIESSKNIPVSLATYSAQGRDGKKSFIVRGFVATGDICGDLEFYSETPISAEDPDLRKIFESYRLDPGYTPQFKDVLLYAQVLYKHQMYQAAAPIFEQALSKLNGNEAQQTVWRRVNHRSSRDVVRDVGRYPQSPCPL